MTSYDSLWHLISSSFILCQVMSSFCIPCTTYNIFYILQLPAMDITRLSNFLEVPDWLTDSLTIAIPRGAFFAPKNAMWELNVRGQKEAYNLNKQTAIHHHRESAVIRIFTNSWLFLAASWKNTICSAPRNCVQLRRRLGCGVRIHNLWNSPWWPILGTGASGI